ncbi:MAG: prolipoprotein diacylglyceryl transferase [Puniceicoccales bacterium]|jgi:phosphatidylglycerol:prolipoprotein diacylglycerol transferase|nr:prolipoprotein diacylglyceryl transferase [Puniceicoccales bacterium]
MAKDDKIKLVNSGKITSNYSPAMIFGYILHNIDPFIFRFPEWFAISGIRWYGMFYVISFLVTFAYLNYASNTGKSVIKRDQNEQFVLFCAAGVIIGGRLGYWLLYDSSAFLANPLVILKIWNGGMASHGGFIGVILSLIIFSRKNKLHLLSVADLVSSIAPIGLFLGRIGNFINGELVGKISNLPWAMKFTNHGTISPETLLPRHPSQLYEAFFEGIFLFLYLQCRMKKKSIPGVLSGEFLIAYSCARFFCEFFREPDAPPIFTLSRGQFFSIFSLLFGILLIIYVMVVDRLHPNR